MKKKAIVDPVVERPLRAIIFGDNAFARGVPARLICYANDGGKVSLNAVMVRDNPGNKAERRYNRYDLSFKDGLEDIDCITDIIDGYNDFDSVSGLADNEGITALYWAPEKKNWYLPNGKMQNDKHNLLYQLTMLLFRRFCQEKHGYEIVSFVDEVNNGEKLKSEIIEYSTMRGLGMDFINWLLMENKFYTTFTETRLGKAVHGHQLEIEAEDYMLCLIDKRDGFLSLSGHILVYDRPEEYHTLREKVYNGALTACCGYALLHEVKSLAQFMKMPKLVKHMTVSVFEEIIPTVDVNFEITQAFTVEMLQRFEDDYITTLWRSYAEGVGERLKTSVIPTIRRYYEMYQKFPKHLVFALFCTIEMYKAYNINDSFNEKLKQSTDILSDTALWGEDITYLKSELEAFDQRLK